ncbi:chromate transporter [Fusibacter paucivorans]|uniref:Chromate transporter n=1 Tax=Fusibacter paucivorans TaxID=76009 RepID=A0ABS5PQ32_9FIRM|nr:chromate transporter [Fusibacter paucivorans]MBS7526696.1 chromate transporter [Fusibacter paucivorans]
MGRYLRLWAIFFKVGLLTIGGGYAMLPILEKELTGEKAIMDMTEVLECYSLAQSLPGVIASNTAAFIGYRLGGIPGAFACVLGVISPSIVIITFIAMIFEQMKQTIWVQKAFQGVRIVVLVLLIDSLRRMAGKALDNRFDIFMAVVSFILVFTDILSPVGMLIIAAIVMNIYGRKRGSV